MRLDADHHVYACFFPRNKKTGEVVKARGMLRLKALIKYYRDIPIQNRPPAALRPACFPPSPSMRRPLLPGR
jgi:hypothetical protein